MPQCLHRKTSYYFRTISLNYLSCCRRHHGTRLTVDTSLISWHARPQICALCSRLASLPQVIGCDPCSVWNHAMHTPFCHLQPSKWCRKYLEGSQLGLLGLKEVAQSGLGVPKTSPGGSSSFVHCCQQGLKAGGTGLPQLTHHPGIVLLPPNVHLQPAGQNASLSAASTWQPACMWRFTLERDQQCFGAEFPDFQEH